MVGPEVLGSRGQKLSMNTENRRPLILMKDCDSIHGLRTQVLEDPKGYWVALLLHRHWLSANHTGTFAMEVKQIPLKMQGLLSFHKACIN